MKTRMRIIARILVFALICIQFSGAIENTTYAFADTEMEVNNGFVKYTVNSENGRFSISTDKGAAYKDDENQPLLFEEYVPDTSFTTFRIDGEDYIYGNNYGFLDMDGHMENSPINMGLVNSSTWTINGLDIIQTLTLDNTDENAGNVKINYSVKNTTDKEVKIGSRILLDTMLGINDGSPVILPGNQSFVEKESKYVGEDVPVYWKSVDNKDFVNVVSYGLNSGWRNTVNQDDYYNAKPDEMIIGHWEGLSKTKWTYDDFNPNLNFTSINNAYGSRDSAVALYWNEQSLLAGEERVYETYYGLGKFTTGESEIPVSLNTYAPERLYLNDTKTAYTSDTVTISGEIDNSLNGSQPLINAKATLISYTAGLTLPYGESKTIELGTIDANSNSTTSFSWDLNTSKLYSWTNFQYRVSLTADNLTQPITRDGGVLIPSINGQPPEIKFTEYFPGNLYNLDDNKVLTITGQNLDAIENSIVIIRSEKDKNGNINEYIIKPGDVNENDEPCLIIANTSITVNIPDSLGLKDKGLYNVTVEYIEAGDNKSFAFDAKLNLSTDMKYMIRKYGILMAVRVEENGEYTYKLVNAKDETELEALKDNESVILDIRADEIIKAGDVYTINSKTATINSVVTCQYYRQYGDDPMTIEKKVDDLSHHGDYVFLTGKGRLEIPGFAFHNGPYELELEDGTFYSTTDEEDAEDVVIEKPLVYKGWPVVDYSLILQAIPISINAAVLREHAITFGGSIDLAQLLNGASKISEEKKDKKKDDDDDDDEDENDVDLGASLNIEDLRFGVNNGYVTLAGLKADGSVGIPKEITKKIIPDVDLGAEVKVSIDTFDNWRFELNADINFEIIQAKGDIVFKIFEIEGIPIPIPDTCIVYGGNKHPGIPLIPIAPIGYLTGLGGGFKELYDTVTLNFNFLPPLTLSAIASFNLFQVLEANEVTLEVSARGISFNVAEVNIGPMEIFKDFGTYVYVKDDLENPGFEMKTYAGLSLKDWVTGEAYYLCAVDMAKKGRLGPLTIIGEASGSVQVPGDSPVFAGTEFASANFSIGDEGIFAKLTALGFIPAAFSYYWGGEVVLGIASTDNQGFEERGMYAVANYDKEGNQIGTICFGENFHVISDSRSEVRFASLLNDLPRHFAGLDKYKLNIIDHDYSIIEVEYYGDEPEVHLYKPDNSQVELTENTNYFKQEALGIAVNEASKIYIPLKSPENGEWELSSSKVVNTRLIKVDEIIELKEVNAKLEEVNGKKKLDVNWTSEEEITDEKVNIILCEEKENDPGKMIASDLIAKNASALVDLPEELASGDYYVKVQLLNGEGAVFSTVVSDDTINYIDQNQPDSITNMSVYNIGNGLLNVTWDNPTSADGYMIDVIDVETKERVSSFDSTENTGDNIIGGTYKQISSLTKSKSADEVENSGMIPGREYIISVSSYNDVNKIKHYAKEVTGLVTINQPDPANIAYEVNTITGQIEDKGIKEEVQTYLTKEQNINLSLNSRQGVKWKVTVNDDVIYDQTDNNTYTDTETHISVDLTEEENYIGIKAVNDKGDITKEGFMVELDQEPPVLRIDYPRQGEMVKDNIIISGFVDLNSSLKINGQAAEYDNNGLFNIQIPMGDNMTQTILVEASDQANNKSEYVAEVYNDKIKDIKDIKIVPNTNQVIVGEEVDYDVYLVDEDENEFTMDDSLITWSLLNNYGVIDVNEDGVAKALLKGNDVLLASYKTSKTCYEEDGQTKEKYYAFEDAVIIEVVEENRETEKIIVNTDYINIRVNEYHTLDVYEVFTGGSNRLLNNELVSFTIVSGSEFIDISDIGEIHAKTIGDENESENAIVSVSYVKNGKVYDTNVMIHITKEKVEENSSSHKLSADDQFIIDILKKISNPDGSATFEIKKSQIKKVDGKAKVILTVEGIKRAFTKAYVNEDGMKKIILQIPLVDGLDGYVIDIPKKVLNAYKGNIIEIETSIGTISLPCHMLTDSQLSGTGNISFIIEKINEGFIDDETKVKIGDRPIIEISIMEDGNLFNWKNDNTPVKVYMGYTPVDGEDYEKIVVLYIDEDGKAIKVKNGKYDAETGMVVFETTHLSTYALAYEEKNFSDIVNYPWAKHQIEVLASKGIINGTSKAEYSPGINITRADFLTLLVRTLEMTADIDSNFDDVKQTDYFYESVAIAKQLGITTGSGNNMFNPKDSITRQDMMVLTERALTIKCKLIEECDIAQLDKFTDKGKISTYAENSILVLVNKGLINGSNGKINPQGNTTRAEVAVLLYRIYNE